MVSAVIPTFGRYQTISLDPPAVYDRKSGERLRVLSGSRVARCASGGVRTFSFEPLPSPEAFLLYRIVLSTSLLDPEDYAGPPRGTIPERLFGSGCFLDLVVGGEVVETLTPERVALLPVTVEVLPGSSAPPGEPSPAVLAWAAADSAAVFGYGRLLADGASVAVRLTMDAAPGLPDVTVSCALKGLLLQKWPLENPGWAT